MNQFSTTEELKAYLLAENPQFRDLANEHRQFEERLGQLASLSYPNDDELVEEKSLKKKKLLIKDQMESILAHYRHPESS